MTIDALRNGISNNRLSALGIAAGAGAVAGAIGGSVVTSSLSRKTRRKSRTSRKRNTMRRKSRKQKRPYTAGKGKDRSTKRIRYTKNNQPYVIMSSGKARFIKKSSVRLSRKRKGGRY